jgi:hypothetical protein
VIAPQTLLDIKGTTRAGHGGFGEPFLVELLLLVFSNELAENRFAKAQLHELTLFGVLLERQILQYDALRLRDWAILDRTMPYRQNKLEITDKIRIVNSHVRLQNPQKENEQAGHMRSLSPPTSVSDSKGLGTGLWQKTIGQ